VKIADIHAIFRRHCFCRRMNSGTAESASLGPAKFAAIRTQMFLPLTFRDPVAALTAETFRP
jgi:hypothetical protein